MPIYHARLLYIQDAWEIPQFMREVQQAIDDGMLHFYEVPDEVHGQGCAVYLCSKWNLDEEQVNTCYYILRDDEDEEE